MEVGFEVAEYDTTKPLVIDPTIVYSTYLGGNDFEDANGIAVDSDGNAYVTGAQPRLIFRGSTRCNQLLAAVITTPS
jgi:hypothetical protein